MAPTNTPWPRSRAFRIPRRPWLATWLACWLAGMLAVIVVPEVADYSGPEVIAFLQDAALVAVQGAIFGTVLFVLLRGTR